MALDHKQAAKEILEAVGGPENIVSAAHCATRLRLVVADDSKVDKAKVDNAAGAKGSFQASGQLQVIYGTGTVNKVFDEFIALAGISASSKDEAKAAAAAKANPFQRAIKALGDVFVPIIPAIVASGLLMHTRRDPPREQSVAAPLANGDPQQADTSFSKNLEKIPVTFSRSQPEKLEKHEVKRRCHDKYAQRANDDGRGPPYSGDRKHGAQVLVRVHGVFDVTRKAQVTALILLA